MQKNNIGLKIKIKKRGKEEEEENSTELQKDNVEAEVYNNKMWIKKNINLKT